MLAVEIEQITTCSLNLEKQLFLGYLLNQTSNLNEWGHPFGGKTYHSGISLRRLKNRTEAKETISNRG